jgi:hypothetical protein
VLPLPKVLPRRKAPPPRKVLPLPKVLRPLNSPPKAPRLHRLRKPPRQSRRLRKEPLLRPSSLRKAPRPPSRRLLRRNDELVIVTFSKKPGSSRLFVCNGAGRANRGVMPFP